MSHSDSHLAALYAEECWECLNGADVAQLCISNEGRLSLPHFYPYQIQSLRRRHVDGRLLVVSCKDILPYQIQLPRRVHVGRRLLGASGKGIRP